MIPLPLLGRNPASKRTAAASTEGFSPLRSPACPHARTSPPFPYLWGGARRQACPAPRWPVPAARASEGGAMRRLPIALAAANSPAAGLFAAITSLQKPIASRRITSPLKRSAASDVCRRRTTPKKASLGVVEGLARAAAAAQRRGPMPSGEAAAVLLEHGCLPFWGLGDRGICVPVESEEGSGLAAEFRCRRSSLGSRPQFRCRRSNL